MEQTRQLKPSIWRIIGYVLILALVIFAYVFTDGYFFIAVIALLILLPIASLVSMWKLAQRLTVRMQAVPAKVTLGEQVLLELQLQNELWIPALDCEWELETGNTFWENSSRIRVSMPVQAHDTTRLCMPIVPEEIGRFEVVSSHMWLRDFFGLARCRIATGVSASVYVTPAQVDTEDIEIQDYLYGVAECEESEKKGNDFSEVSDIREYVPGDRIRDIHWKLSAKQEALMVKERIAMSGSEMVLLVRLNEEQEVSRKILSFAYSVGLEFVKLQTPVCILCWNQSRYAFDEYRCMSETELKDAFCGIYDVPLKKRLSEDVTGYLGNCYPYLHTYLTVLEKEGRMQVEMRENG